MAELFETSRKKVDHCDTCCMNLNNCTICHLKEICLEDQLIPYHCDICCLNLKNCTNCKLKENYVREDEPIPLIETQDVSPPKPLSDHNPNQFCKKNFTCNYCVKTFCSKFSMVRHEYQLHKKLRDVEKPKPFKCTCGKAYSTKANLKRYHP